MFDDVGRNPDRRVGDRDHDVLACGHVGVANRIVVVKIGVARLDGELAVPLHGVARIDRQIQEGVLHLNRVDVGVPQAPGDDGLDLHPVAQRPAKDVVRAADQAAEIDDLRRERLPSSESQQLRGEFRAARDGGDRRLQALVGARIAGDVAAKQLQIAADDLQDVVEVVRDAAGELADRLHLLRLAQLRLGLGAFGDRAGDALLQQRVGLPQNLFGFLAVGDVDDRADVSEKFAIVAEARSGGAQRPAIAVVGAPQPVFDPERIARGVGFDKGALPALAVVGMHGLPGAGAERLLLPLPGEFRPEPIEVGERAGRIGHPHHDRRVVGHVAEARLALAQFAGRLAPQAAPSPDLRSRGRSVRARRRAWSGSRPRLASRPSTRASSPARADSTITGMSRKCGVLAQRAQQAEAVEPRHHDVRQDEIRFLRPDRLQRRDAVGDDLDVPSRLEQPADVVAHVRVVVGHQDARASRPSWDRKSRRRRRDRPAHRPASPSAGSQRSASSTKAPARSDVEARDALLADPVRREMAGAERDRDR